ncbi:hypothetical protein EYF80_003039 [Liparis tanakae]|uniref:Uncharacterized protein n=1 Tax=Liparis tanakae TaxID=230148 RepID=A0A4Z2J9F7_9TELE|nr:hypothetical protein EYF80_003039 [Liparis tanakae]
MEVLMNGPRTGFSSLDDNIHKSKETQDVWGGKEGNDRPRMDEKWDLELFDVQQKVTSYRGSVDPAHTETPFNTKQPNEHKAKNADVQAVPQRHCGDRSGHARLHSWYGSIELDLCLPHPPWVSRVRAAKVTSRHQTRPFAVLLYSSSLPLCAHPLLEDCEEL